MWEEDKRHLSKCQENCTSMKEVQDKLQMQLRATKMQLTKSKELLGLQQQANQSSMEANLDANQEPEIVREPRTPKCEQEVCIFELLKPGSCNKVKGKCKFSHEINEHLMIDTVIS